MYQPKNMLVTGGAGFIGCNFIHHVLQTESDIHIINVDNFTYAGSLDNLQDFFSNQNHCFIQGNITNTKLIQNIMLRYDVDTIVNFAAETHVDRSIYAPNIFFETNVMGTQNLLAVAKKLWLENKKLSQDQCRFHQVSTDEVYGTLNIDDHPFTEETAYHPRSPYAASKASADHLVKAYFYTYGLPISISNCSNNYGPYQHREKFIPSIINACMQHQKIPVYGQGRNRRDWLHVKDHCRAIMAILKYGRPGENYNIGGHNEWENIGLVKYLCAQLDQLRPQPSPYESLIEFVTDRPGHDFRYAVDTTKISTELGWLPQLNFDIYIKQYLDQEILSMKPVRS